MTAPGHTFRPAGPDDVSSMATLYASTFWANPCYRAIFLLSNEEEERAALRWFFSVRVRMLIALGNTFLVAEEEGRSAGGGRRRLVGAVGIVAPTRRPTLWSMLRHGLGTWVCRYGAASLGRALAVDEACKVGASRRSGAVAWELVMMAVDPSVQGKGVGTELLKRLLQALASSSSGGPLPRIVLSTQEPHAARMYGRFGFVDDVEEEEGGGTAKGGPVEVRFGDQHPGARNFRTWSLVLR
jgi:ribosomal protein S18 acetylase RimI-like enzyme